MRDRVAAAPELREREVDAREQHADGARERRRRNAAIERHAVDVREQRRRRAVVIGERGAVDRGHGAWHGQAVARQMVQHRELEPDARAALGAMDAQHDACGGCGACGLPRRGVNDQAGVFDTAACRFVAGGFDSPGGEHAVHLGD